jgi:hypothetical protein
MRALRVARTLARAAVAVAPSRVAPTPARSPVAAMASRAAFASSASGGAIPRAPADGAKTQLLVVTTPALMSSNPLARLRGADAAMPSDRFDVHLGVEIGDFPSDVLRSREGPPVAVLWWFGDAKVMGEILDAPCATSTSPASSSRDGRVTWLHSGSAGVEHILAVPRVRDAAAPLTNARGAFSASLGEWVMFASMWFAKRVHAMRVSQAKGEWMRDTVGMLQGKTMSIVGYGDIGRACATRAKAFGMKVIALRRDPSRSAGDDAVDETLPLSALRRAMVSAARRVSRASVPSPLSRSVRPSSLVAPTRPGSRSVSFQRKAGPPARRPIPPRLT